MSVGNENSLVDRSVAQSSLISHYEGGEGGEEREGNAG